MIVATNPAREIGEFYPPPYQRLAPRVFVRRKDRGVGQITPQQGISFATTGASAGAAIAGASGSALIGGLTIGSAIPIFGTIAGVLAGILANAFKGCGQACTLTSDAANQVEQALQQNLAAYFSSPRTQADQQAALANFDNAWAQLVQYCGNPSFGDPGKRCTSDRDSSSCAYHTSPGSWNGCTWQGAGANNSGSTCWNWFVGYRDPIANDPCVQPNAPVPTTAAPIPNTTGISPSSVPAQLPSTIAGLNLSSFLLPALLLGGGILVMALD